MRRPHYLKVDMGLKVSRTIELNISFTAEQQIDSLGTEYSVLRYQ